MFAILSLAQLSNHLFEELAMDVYDEVDRRETDAGWVWRRLPVKRCQALFHLRHAQSGIVFCSVAGDSEPQHAGDGDDGGAFPSCQSWVFIDTEPGTPTPTETNARLSDRPTTDLGFLTQGRQKLARFNAHEFATLVIDILSDAKRRQQGNSIGSPKGQQLKGCYMLSFPNTLLLLQCTDMSQLFCPVRHQKMWISCWKVSLTARKTTTTVCRLTKTQIKTSPPAKVTGPR